jgi:hypothetical protein
MAGGMCGMDEADATSATWSNPVEFLRMLRCIQAWNTAGELPPKPNAGRAGSLRLEEPGPGRGRFSLSRMLAGASHRGGSDRHNGLRGYVALKRAKPDPFCPGRPPILPGGAGNASGALLTTIPLAPSHAVG